MKQRRRACQRALTLGTAILIVAAVLGLGPAAASAAPTEPMLTVAQLEALLATSPDGTADGYFETVLRGTTVVRIPVTVKSVVPYSIAAGSLILFQAHGPAIEEIGGVAGGMSGSPLFVDDQGTHKLVGAVSYGDIFTRGYLALATPVEYMATMEDTFLPADGVTVTLPEPVSAAGRTVSRVTVAASAREAREVRPRRGTAVMAPLATLALSGLPPGSAAYKDIAARLERQGLELAPHGSLLAGERPTLQAPLVGGSSVAALVARGDVVFGALGTVTWNDGDRVVAFGHPLWGLGSVELFLTGGYVHGVWASDISPYKLASPTGLAGSLLQDRGTGIAGRLGRMPEEAPVTGAVTLQPQGAVGRTTSYVPRWFITGFPWGDGVYITADILGSAGYRASDNAATPGGGATTTTVVVEDAAGTRYTVARANTWDDAFDVLWSLSTDAALMLGALVADPDGVAPAEVVSVDMRGSVSPARSAARIVAVRLPRGLPAGVAAPVEVVLNLHGDPTPLVVKGTIDVPAGASPTGGVNVYPAMAVPGGEGGEAPSSSPDEPKTVAERVADVRALPTNDQLVVQLVPDGVDGGGAREREPHLTPPEAGPPGSVQTTLTVAGRFVTGSLQLRVGRLTLRASPSTARYRGAFTVSGGIAETQGAGEVDIYARPYGDAERTWLATVPAEPDGTGGATFAYRTGGFATTTQLTAEWAGDARATGASASVTVRVAQSVSLTADRAGVKPGETVRLAARVLPGRAGQVVRFERRSAGSWLPIKTVRAVAGAAGVTATLDWEPPAGVSRVRARAPATPANAGGVSASLTLRASAR